MCAEVSCRALFIRHLLHPLIGHAEDRVPGYDAPEDIDVGFRQGGQEELQCHFSMGTGSLKLNLCQSNDALVILESLRPINRDDL